LNVTYKVFAKFLYDRLLPNAAVQHYQAGFQSGKSTTDELFAFRQILEKCNELNITTHHLFIDCKEACDTIIRNKVNVGLSELNFPAILLRFTKATLTIVTSCLKIQNDSSKPFDTRQGLRQGDAAFQCRAGSYRTTSKPTNNRHNLQQRSTTTRICR
jgi:hypothetical protein